MPKHKKKNPYEAQRQKKIYGRRKSKHDGFLLMIPQLPEFLPVMYMQDGEKGLVFETSERDANYTLKRLTRSPLSPYYQSKIYLRAVDFATVFEWTDRLDTPVLFRKLRASQFEVHTVAPLLEVYKKASKTALKPALHIVGKSGGVSRILVGGDRRIISVEL